MKRSWRTRWLAGLSGAVAALLSGVAASAAWNAIVASGNLGGSVFGGLTVLGIVGMVMIGVITARRVALRLAGSTRSPKRWTLADEVRKQASQPIPPEASQPPIQPLTGNARKLFYVSAIELESIRCFERLKISFTSQETLLTTLILGDNSTGKSTILRSIALGVCPESEAVALIKKLPGRFLRNGAKEGVIRVHLRSADGLSTGKIETRIQGSGDQEIVRQKTSPSKFPWHKIFVCGYGTQRTAQATRSHEAYTPPIALATLFEDAASLQNPELFLRRRPEDVRSRVERAVQQILMLDEQDHTFELTNTGLTVSGPWGTQPLANISDGYRSTIQWVSDFLSWQVLAEHLDSGGAAGGILLIDELEQHLHPRWQRFLLQRLRAQFPHVQIIATTHTPLIAAALADLDSAQLLRLRSLSKQEIEVTSLDPTFLRGKRADQVLASAFGVLTSRSPGSATDITRYAQLAAAERSPEQEEEYQRLRRVLDDESAGGSTPYERAVAQALSKTLDRMIEDGSKKLDHEARRQLRELFHGKEEKHLGVTVSNGVMHAKTDEGQRCIDIFGLNDRDQLRDDRVAAISRIKDLLIKYMYEPSTRPDTLKQMNAILDGEKRCTLASRAAAQEMMPLADLLSNRRAPDA